jgi:cytochrome c oxidase subunit II
LRPHGTDRPLRRPARRTPTRALILGSSLVVVLLGATGCASEELPRLAMPSPASEEGARILSLWQGTWVAALITGGAVWGLILWSSAFHRRRSNELPVQTRYNVPIEALYTVIPFIIIAVLFFFTARDQTILVDTSEEPDHTVNVVGRQWSWTFNYIDENVWDAGTPGKRPVLYLPEGQLVRFELTSPDVIHSFWVPAFLFKLDVIPGRVNMFQLTPNKQGRYAGKCAELCGVDHARMLFDVEVVSQSEYDPYIAGLEAAGKTGTLPKGITGDDRSAQ